MRQTIWILSFCAGVFFICQHDRGWVAKAECPPVSTTPSQLTYADSWLFQWDPTNPTHIAPDESAAIRVVGGFAPFHWQLAGDGFYLTQSATDGHRNVLYAEAGACGTATITVSDHFQRITGGNVRIDGPEFAWDADNSPREFPEGDLPVTVFVSGGRPPYDWEVSEGFRLGCSQGCGSQNGLSVIDKTVCVADITVTDACGTEVQGSVRRQGYWQRCFTHKDPSCFVHNRCGNSPELDFGRHLVQVTCCRHGTDVVSGACDVDNWQFTAVGGDCTLDNDCELPMVWAFYIWYWVCF
jgi:hypothetical protein